MCEQKNNLSKKRTTKKDREKDEKSRYLGLKLRIEFNQKDLEKCDRSVV